jgi:hypothetical protein
MKPWWSCTIFCTLAEGRVRVCPAGVKCVKGSSCAKVLKEIQHAAASWIVRRSGMALV